MGLSFNPAVDAVYCAAVYVPSARHQLRHFTTAHVCMCVCVCVCVCVCARVRCQRCGPLWRECFMHEGRGQGPSGIAEWRIVCVCVCMCMRYCVYACVCVGVVMRESVSACVCVCALLRLAASWVSQVSLVCVCVCVCVCVRY